MENSNVIARYNRLMYYLCCEYLTIGEKLSEDTDGWGIPEMVNACKYQLSLYTEGGHMLSDLKQDDYKQWLSETNKLKRFIATYSK